MNDSRISVLVPFHNREKYLLQALESIASQTYKDWRVILYDDGSTDGSREIAEEWLRKNNGFLIRGEENKGVGYARNVLLDAIDTPYACWMDSDDWSHPERLEKQLLELWMGNDIVFSYLRFFRGDNPEATRSLYKLDVTKYDSREGLYNNMTFATGVFVKELSRFKFPLVDRKEDVEWLLTLIEANTYFGCVEEPLYHVRRHDERLTPAKK